MPESSEKSQDILPLNCLEGRPAPPIVVEGWGRFGDFSEKTRNAFWRLLAQVLLTPGNRANQELTALFCREHDTTPDAALAAMGCFEVLLGQSAALDLGIEAFRQDLATLSGDAGDLIDFVLKYYPQAKQELRRKILMESLAAHGKVMTDLEWRFDKIQHSSRGNRLNADIVLLTLHYNEGPREDRITLQLTQEAARKLKAFGERVSREE